MTAKARARLLSWACASDQRLSSPQFASQRGPVDDSPRHTSITSGQSGKDASSQ